MTTTPDTDRRPIAHVAREADIDLRLLESRPPYWVPDTIRGASDGIRAAVARHHEVHAKRAEAARGCREALMSILTVRQEHRENVAEAALSGESEPEEPNVSAIFETARSQYRRTLALSDALATSRHHLMATLADSDVLVNLRKAECDTAREALDLYAKVDEVLQVFAQQRAEAFWLAEFIHNDKTGRSNVSPSCVKPVEPSIKEAEKALYEEVLYE